MSDTLAYQAGFDFPHKQRTSCLEPESGVDWFTASLMTAKGLSAAANCLPFPYVDCVFKLVVVFLETVEVVNVISVVQLKKNRDDLRELSENTVEIMRIISDYISSKTAASKLRGLCEELERSLRDVLEVVTPRRKDLGRFRDRAQAFLKLSRTTDDIRKYEKKIRELRSNFMV
ncbi:hypothetical protein K438DRAFT_1778364 [Mycena galopus ATCC 62051]|nr:hypothetical protein K438DRAFT_1778364 [Mycena galopus ATCC 62051]